MSRSLSSTFLTAIHAQETTSVFLILLEIDHDDLTAPIRVVNNTKDITSGGNTYVAFPFMIEMPHDIEDQLPEIQLTIDNVDRSIVEAIRTITTPPTVSISVILAATPNTIQIGPINFTLREASYDVLTVSGTLTPEDLLTESFPKQVFSPNEYPGLF